MTRVVAVAAALVISLCSPRSGKCDAQPAVATLAPASCFYATFNPLYFIPQLKVCPFWKSVSRKF